MEYVAIIISLISLVGAGFAFIRANSSHHILGKRIETLKEKNSLLEARLRKAEGNSGRGNRAVNEPNESGRRNKQRGDQQPEARQNQPRQERQNEPKQRQPRPEQQPEQRQERKERQPQQPQQQENAALPQDQQQPRRKRENRRRNEPRERQDLTSTDETRPLNQGNNPRLEFTQGDILDELEQSAATPAETPDVVESGTRYAIIPEDGVIRAHQLQQQPDSDSYIEVDLPADGGHITKYRFNLAGNHAFVIAQGIDRLENAFDFEKPSNRMVSKVVQQQDGVLTRVGNGWRIHEKARIDFR